MGPRTPSKGVFLDGCLRLGHPFEGVQLTRISFDPPAANVRRIQSFPAHQCPTLLRRPHFVFAQKWPSESGPSEGPGAIAAVSPLSERGLSALLNFRRSILGVTSTLKGVSSVPISVLVCVIRLEYRATPSGPVWHLVLA